MSRELKEREKWLSVMELGGWFLVVVGIVMIIGFNSLPGVGKLFDIAGIVAILFGLVWVKKVRKVKRRYHIRATSKSRTLAYVFIPILMYLSFFASMSFVQAYGTNNRYSTVCYEIWNRVKYLEYFSIGMLIITLFLTLGPLVLGRTVLGPIMQEFQGFSGIMILVLLFIFSFLYPLDPMFVFPKTGSQNMCYIDIDNLKDSGPPAMRLLLKMISIPTGS